MTNTTNVLTQDIQNKLYPYQIDKINRQVKDYVHLNKKAKSFSFDVCPKCGAIHPSFGKGGYTKAGKPMIKCLECGRRFVYDYGQFIILIKVKINGMILSLKLRRVNP